MTDSTSSAPFAADAHDAHDAGNPGFGDRLLTALDTTLRTLCAPPRASRPTPTPPDVTPDAKSGADAAATTAPALTDSEKRLSGALMRVDHVGEVCAQALYTAQAFTTRDPALRRHFERAAREETDHLAWTKQRLDELGDRTSLLNPLWYAGAFAIGLVAGRLGGDPVSLGFVVETERQVEAHLAGHMERLPAGDAASRAIVEQMKVDEARHADDALAKGGVALPEPVRGLMRLAAKVMTTTAHYV